MYLQGGPGSLMAASDAEQKDQQPSADNSARSLMDKSSASVAAAPSSGSTLLTMEAGNDALTFSSSAKVTWGTRLTAC